MITFLIATTHPGKTALWLANRGILQVNPNAGEEGEPPYIPARRGLKGPHELGVLISDFPNLKWYAFRLAHEAGADDDERDVDVEGNLLPDFDRSKLVKYVKNNGTRVDFDWNRPIAYDENGNVTETEVIPLTAWRINFDGGQFYVMPEHPKLHRWQ